MAFLDNSGDIILDAVLTDTGRARLAKGDGTFKIAKYALADDEIDYELYDATHSEGSTYYDLDILSETLERLIIEADSKIFKVHYAIKANTNSRLLNLIRSHGLGIDAVSGNEIKKSIEETAIYFKRVN